MRKNLKKDSRLFNRFMENLEKKQEIVAKQLQAEALVISSEEYIERSQGARSIIVSAPVLNDIQRKRPAEDASPFITPPPNLRNCTSRSIQSNTEKDNEVPHTPPHNKEYGQESDDNYISESSDELLEINSLDSNEVSLRNILLEILHERKSQDLKLDKTLMNSNFLNGIIDLTDTDVKKQLRSKLNQEQRLWLDRILEKQIWIPTSEFKDFCGQFTEDACDRVQIPTLVRKSFIVGRFDPFFHEGHDIAQDIMKHFSVRLEAPNNSESNESGLERTYAIDTTIYIVNRIFRMHQDVLERTWLEILTKDTKNRKIDGALKVLKTKKKEHQTICITEFSYGEKAPDSKETSDNVKLARNAKRILNKLLDTVCCKEARVYTIQSVNGQIYVQYMVRPFSSIYLCNEFTHIKIPKNFIDMEQFAIDMKGLMDFQKDILRTVRSINKSIGDKDVHKNVHKSKVETTPQKARTKKNK